MKKHVLVLGLSTLFSASLLAGTSTITGSASVARAPEFINLTLSIKSECYATPMEAMTANNLATARVQEILGQFVNKEDATDGIFTNGGLTADFSKTVYTEEGSKEICVGTFQQVTDVRFKTGNIQKFSDVFAQIQWGVLENFARGSRESEGAVTYVTIDTPSAEVCEETKRGMARQAAQLAVDNAIGIFNAYAEQCMIQGNVEIKTIGEPEQVYHAHASYKEFASPGAGAGAGAGPGGPVVMTRFQDVVESAQVSVQFEYPTTTFGCRLPMMIDLTKLPMMDLTKRPRME